MANTDIKSLVEQIAPTYGVPVKLMLAVGMQESGLNPNAIGDGGDSHGAWQINLPSHPQVTTQQAHDPVFSTNYAAKLLSAGYKKYGNWTDSVSSYNSGKPLPQAPASTRSYVASIAANIKGEVAGAGAMAGGGAATGGALGVSTKSSQFNLPKPKMRTTPFAKISTPASSAVKFKIPEQKFKLSKSPESYKVRMTGTGSANTGIPKISPTMFKIPKTTYPKVKPLFNLGSLRGMRG